MFDEPLIFERGSPGRVGWPVPGAAGEGVAELPAHLRREDDLAGMPEVSELEALRHFLRLSQWNYSAATTLYPLGSCTMKYNPVVNEALARLPGFATLHPLVPDRLAQGALELIAGLEAALAALSGLDAVCLQPAAGAQGRRPLPRAHGRRPARRHGRRRHAVQPAQDLLDAARGRGPRSRAGRRAGAARAVPARAEARPERRRTRLERRRAAERRPHAVL